MYKQYILSQLVKEAGILADLSKGVSNGTKGTIANIVIPTADTSESLAEQLGYNISEAIMPKKTDGDDEDLGPYKSVVRHLKDTELAEAYLRAAAILRRKTRILKKRRALEEGLRSSVARSRFF